jgi:sodium/potassium-transporting ATPase subunit alpha
MDGESKDLDDLTRAKIEEIKNTWSAQGRRVILLARKVVLKEQIRSLPSSGQLEDDTIHHSRTGLTLVGIVGIVDPPRDEIPSVVRILRGAGIKILMASNSAENLPCKLTADTGNR